MIPVMTRFRLAAISSLLLIFLLGPGVLMASSPLQIPNDQPGEDPPIDLDDVQAMYPGYDCVQDTIGGYWLAQYVVPFMGDYETYSLRSGDVLVFMGVELKGDRVFLGAHPYLAVSDVVFAGRVGYNVEHMKLRAIGAGASITVDGTYYVQVVGGYIAGVAFDLPIAVWVPEAYLAICHPLPPTATPTLPPTFTPNPSTSDGWVLIHEFVVDSPGSLTLPDGTDQFYIDINRDVVSPQTSGQTFLLLNNQYVGDLHVGSGGSCFAGTGARDASVFLSSVSGPRVLSWVGWDAFGGNPWCSGSNWMTRARVRVFAPVGYVGIPPLPYLSPPPNRSFIGAWRGAGPLDMTIPVGSLVRVRLMAGLPTNRDARFSFGSSSSWFGSGGGCASNAPGDDFVAPSSQLSIRSLCRYAYLEFEVWSPEQATVTPTQTFTPSPTWTVTRTPTPTRTYIPTRTPTPTFHIGQCPAYQINGTRDLVLHGYWMLFRSSAVVVKAVQINGQAVDLTLPVWGSQGRPLYLNPAGQFARIRLQAVGSTPGVAYFCEAPMPTPTSLLVTRTRTVTATPTGTVTATPTRVVDDFEPVCDWEPCVTVSYAQVLFERLARDDSFAAPPVSQCRAHLASLLPPPPTRTGFERIAGGPSPMVTADGICQVVEITEPWRDVMRGVITIALVGIIFIGIALRVGREIGGASSG